MVVHDAKYRFVIDMDFAQCPTSLHLHVRAPCSRFDRGTHRDNHRWTWSRIISGVNAEGSSDDTDRAPWNGREVRRITVESAAKCVRAMRACVKCSKSVFRFEIGSYASGSRHLRSVFFVQMAQLLPIDVCAGLAQQLGSGGQQS
jgi:hypothetical protein